MSDFSDVMQRWARPGTGAQCLLNTDDNDLAAWAIRDQTAAVSHCQFRFESHQVCAQLGLTALPFPELPPQRFSDVYWAWPKARAEARMLLDWLPHILAPDGQLWLIGGNRSGIRSAPKALQAQGWTVSKVGSARHCLLLRATPPPSAPAFDLETYWETAALPDQKAAIWSLPGVFAHGRLDKGSLQLLPWLQDIPSPVLDFGCGAGLLSLVASLHQPGLECTGLDNHWLAILSSQRTALENNLNLTTVWADGVCGLEGYFAALITNPPFHEGLHTQYEITHDLLRHSRGIVQSGGVFLAVVNDHLPYADWLREYLNNPQRVAHAQGFSVWSARY